MSTAQLKRLILRFERAADKNQQQRAKFTDDPAKCVQLDPIATQTQCSDTYAADSLTPRQI